MKIAVQFALLLRIILLEQSFKGFVARTLILQNQKYLNSNILLQAQSTNSFLLYLHVHYLTIKLWQFLICHTFYA